MDRATARRLAALAAALGLLALVVGGWLSRVVAEGLRPVLWAVVGWSAVAYATYAARTLAPLGKRRLQDLEALRERRSERSAAIAALRQRLQRISGSFEIDNLAIEQERWRRRADKLPAGPEAAQAWLRVLAIEGPSGRAWVPLGAALLAQGRTRDGLRCVAEGVRCGFIEPAALRDAATPLLPADRPLTVLLDGGDPAALVTASYAAARLPAEALAALYRALAAGGQPVVLRALCCHVACQAVGDREEAARQRERMTDAPILGGDLDLWMRQVWAGFEPGRGWSAEAPNREATDPPPWVTFVPTGWRAALGVGDEPEVPAIPRYDDPLPIYGLPDPGYIEAMAEVMAKIVNSGADEVYSSLASYDTIRRHLTARLWPRNVRGRAAIAEALERLAGIKAEGRVAVGLEVAGAALAEETDPRIDDLREEIERLARGLSAGEAQVRALHAAGYAFAASDPEHAWDLWEESRRLAGRLDRTVAGAMLARMTPTYLAAVTQAETPATAVRALRAAVDAALRSRHPGTEAMALRAVMAQPPGPPRTALLDSFRDHRERLDARGAFLLAWEDRDFNALASAFASLWTDPPRSSPPGGLAFDGAPEAPVKGRSAWAWAGIAMAGRADRGDEDALGRVVVLLRDRARAGEVVALAGWLACAYRLERLERRVEHPQASEALQRFERLPAADLPLPLAAVRTTLSDPAPAWLAKVERTLLRRILRLGRREALDTPAEQRLLEDLIEVLVTARGRAEAETWLERYQADIGVWLEELWSAGTLPGRR